MHGETADDEIHSTGEAESVAAYLDQRPVGCERAQLAPDPEAILARHS
jgi:hypothetical protein